MGKSTRQCTAKLASQCGIITFSRVFRYIRSLVMSTMHGDDGNNSSSKCMIHINRTDSKLSGLSENRTFHKANFPWCTGNIITPKHHSFSMTYGFIYKKKTSLTPINTEPQSQPLVFLKSKERSRKHRRKEARAEYRFATN
ncbi:hypothetical protein F2P81_020471 [Scophthalmus maximus]|uniref:Uncharacterized protein n=1 Tax=Scophthalmus maximus TaxID=52904 RepID=A0A6A4S842_SCOMX|nr:hypothetical protein F2P81_020471 [Scophthalmus maximus]